MTNMERIRGMTEEEMAEFLFGLSDYCPAIGCYKCPLKNSFCYSENLIYYWLKSEVEE